jgi:hypothetical protein
VALIPKESTESEAKNSSEPTPGELSKEPAAPSKEPLGELSDEELGSVSGGFISIGGFAPSTTIKTTL